MVGATAPPSRLARRTGPRRLRRELRRGLQRGLRRGLRRPLRRCNRGGACGQTRKGRVDGGLRAMRRRMIRPSCELTVRAGGGRSGPSERKTRPKPASGVHGQSTAPHKSSTPLPHSRHPARDGASRRAELLRLRRRRPPHSSQASSAVCRRPAPLASAGAAAPGASAETWPSGPQKALALGSVAAAAPPELVPPHPAGAGRGSAKLPCVEYSLPARSSRSESDGLCVGKRGVRGARLIEGG